MDANIADREADNLQDTEKFAFLYSLPGLLVAVFKHRARDVEVWLQQLAHIDADGDATYPPLCDQRWIAYATKDGVPIAMYEFFAGKADPYDPQVSGAKLVGSAITVDAAHLGVGIGRGMMKSLYGEGVLIVPSNKMTEAGAGALQLVAGFRRRCSCGRADHSPMAPLINLDGFAREGISLRSSKSRQT